MLKIIHCQQLSTAFSERSFHFVLGRCLQMAEGFLLLVAFSTFVKKFFFINLHFIGYGRNSSAFLYAIRISFSCKSHRKGPSPAHEEGPQNIKRHQLHHYLSILRHSVEEKEGNDGEDGDDRCKGTGPSIRCIGYGLVDCDVQRLGSEGIQKH